MTGTTISQHHMTAGGQTSSKPNGCAPSSSSCNRRPSGVAKSHRPVPRGRPDRYAQCHSCTLRSQYHFHGLRPRPRADQPTPVKSP
jgi:hypothetical protein